jgi:hypothetical protein
MAHFAKIVEKVNSETGETEWIVERVNVVDDELPTSDGRLGDNDMHVDGETWCSNRRPGTTWKQTSYTGKFRGIFCNIGDKYDPVNDVFVRQKPYSNWVWSDAKNNWVAPVADPSVNADEYNWRCLCILGSRHI